MYYPNFNPYYVHNYYPNAMNSFNNLKKESINKDIDKGKNEEIKKDTVPNNNGTISFPNSNNNKTNIHNEDTKSRLFSFDKENITILGYTIQIDDLIILALIFLLFLESDENYALIIILFLILINTNLSDILSIF